MNTKEIETFVTSAMADEKNENHLWALNFALRLIGMLIIRSGNTVVMALCKNLKEHVRERIHSLLFLMHPRWNCGGDIFDFAPAFSDVKDELIAALDCGVIDYEGFSAVLIGRYGPDAAEVLPELLERLKEVRTDCSKAPGLTWAVYQIGGMRKEVKEILIEIATKSNSCPHSREIATEILKANQVEY